MKPNRFDEEMRRPSPRTLYRAKRGGILFGVFAGVADYFDLNKGGTQLVGFIACMMMPAFIVLYIVLGLILPKKPANLYVDESMEKMWRSYRRSPVGTVDQLKHRFRSLDSRLQKMERYVTSTRYQLDDDFKNL